MQSYNFTDEQFDHFEKLLRVKRHQIELVERMGYNADDEAEILDERITVSLFISFYVTAARLAGVMIPDPLKLDRRYLTRTYAHRTEPDRRLLAFYAYTTRPGADVLDKASADQFQTDIKGHQVRRQPIRDALFISPVPLSAMARKPIQELAATNTQVILDERLLFSPVKHVLYDPHQALTPDQTQRFLKETKLTLGQMPSIRSTDPIVRNFGWPAGTVIQIFRNNAFTETPAQTSVYYRVVVHATES